MKRTRSTIKDIAKAAQVTPTTVSLALNNRSGVSEPTRSRIVQIARDMNYQPDYIARGLRNKQTYTIGLMVKNIADPFYPQLAKEIIDYAQTLNYTTILCNVGDDIRIKTKCLNDLLNKGVDGILTTTVLNDDPYLSQILMDQIPFVAVVRTVTSPELRRAVSSVTLDNFAGGYMAVEHLIKLGHRRIGILAGGLHTSTARLRTAGARQALADAGLTDDHKLVIDCDYDRHLAGQAAKRLLTLKDRPTALFAQDDNMALQAREVVLSRGLSIPEDMALIGFDNIDMAGLTGIELSTIDQKIVLMGQESVSCLVENIQETGAKVKTVSLHPELIIRRSCGYLNKA